MLAAGTGIAPMVQVIHTILDNNDDDTRVKLIYTCRTYHEILMKGVLDTSTDNWNFSVTYAISGVSYYTADQGSTLVYTSRYLYEGR
jgi:NAD(P)H-flavin reductase